MTVAASRYKVGYEQLGTNGTTSLRVTVTDTTTGKAAEPVDVMRENLRDAASRIAGLMEGPDAYDAADVERSLADKLDEITIRPVPLGEMWRSDPELREAVINGMLRRGQVGNLISTSKSYKTYLILGLAISMVVRQWWLETFTTVGGRVLIIDLELQRPDITRRTHDIAQAMKVSLDEVAAGIDVLSFRGRSGTIDKLEPYLLGLPPRSYALVIIDPLYKVYPAQFDENSNPQMTDLYRRFERIAEHLDAGLLVVHHASKGSQADKRVVDVGAGAGSQARSPDCHIALREHEEQDCVVLDARVRSFRPSDPIVLRWQYPQWIPARDLNPDDLRTGRRARNADKPQPQPESAGIEWTAEKFAETFLSDKPVAKDLIVAKAAVAGLSGRKAQQFITILEAEGKAHRWYYAGRGNPFKLASIAQPVTETAECMLGAEDNVGVANGTATDDIAPTYPTANPCPRSNRPPIPQPASETPRQSNAERR